jgi:hypothetical protein
MVPVGVPLEPETVMVAVSLCVLVMVEEPMLTVTAGVTKTAVTVTVVLPVAEEYVESSDPTYSPKVRLPLETALSGVFEYSQDKLCQTATVLLGVCAD